VFCYINAPWIVPHWFFDNGSCFSGRIVKLFVTFLLHVPFQLKWCVYFLQPTCYVRQRAGYRSCLPLCRPYWKQILAILCPVFSGACMLLLLEFSSYRRSTPNGIKFMEIKFCLIVQSHLHQIQYIHMARGFPLPFLYK